jgi:hypothetical protein
MNTKKLTIKKNTTNKIKNTTNAIKENTNQDRYDIRAYLNGRAPDPMRCCSSRFDGSTLTVWKRRVNDLRSNTTGAPGSFELEGEDCVSTTMIEDSTGGLVLVGIVAEKGMREACSSGLTVKRRCNGSTDE